MRLLAILASCMALACADPAWSLPPAALDQDLALLQTAITEAHPGARRYLSETQFAQIFATARSEAAGPMQPVQFYAVVARALSALQDGHTGVDLSEADDAAFRESASVLPLHVYVHDGRVFVLRDLSGVGRSLAGREIRSINGVSASEIVAHLLRATPGDGTIASGREYRLSQELRFNRLLALIYGSAATYRVRVRGSFGDHTRNLNGVTLGRLDQAWAERFPQDHAATAPAELTFKGDVAVLTVRSFSGYADVAHTQRLDEFFEQAFARIARNSARSLIIDVRNNGGGRDELGRALFSYIAQRPFSYYRGLYLQSAQFSFFEHADPPFPGPPPELYEIDVQGRLRWVEHANYGTHQPAADRFAGPVFIVMNGGSFSTTSEFLSVAHANGRATFIGEEAGGGYYGNTSGVTITVTLPNSGLRVRVPLQRYELAVDGFSPADRGVPPEHVVAPSVSDLVAGHDRAMAEALRLARRGR